MGGIEFQVMFQRVYDERTISKLIPSDLIFMLIFILYHINCKKFCIFVLENMFEAFYSNVQCYTLLLRSPYIIDIYGEKME